MGAYLLQAFLVHNSEFEVLLGMAYLMQDHPEVFRKAFPAFDPAQHKSTSGSFWGADRLVREVVGPATVGFGQGSGVN